MPETSILCAAKGVALTGPGKVWIQSLPFSRLVDKIISSVPKMGDKRIGEGSISGGLGDLIDGDN